MHKFDRRTLPLAKTVYAGILQLQALAPRYYYYIDRIFTIITIMNRLSYTIHRILFDIIYFYYYYYYLLL